MKQLLECPTDANGARRCQPRLTHRAAGDRIDLARQIISAALRHCADLGVTVVIQYGRLSRPVRRAEEFGYHHPDRH